MKTVADTDICIYLKIHAHVYQMMFTNALSCIFLYYNFVITASVYCQLLLYLWRNSSIKTRLDFVYNIPIKNE